MSCTETWSAERARPRVTESFPERATAGHVAELRLIIEHLPGETVLPAGLRLEQDSAESKALSSAHFRLPDEKSPVGPRIERRAEGETVTTTVTVPFIPLPPEPGRAELALPELPIAISRASGQLEELCTQEHKLIVEDALTNDPQAELQPDPAPRPQREIWYGARDATLAFLVALPLILLLVWLFRKLWPHLKRTPKAPPPQPPWEVALQALERLSREGLLERGEYELFLDRVSDTLREYLGDRYGFDGLESTTRETLRLLAEKNPHFEFEREVRTILQRADLVKFARRLPEPEECTSALEETKHIVRHTTPSPSLDPRASTRASEKQS